MNSILRAEYKSRAISNALADRLDYRQFNFSDCMHGSIADHQSCHKADPRRPFTFGSHLAGSGPSGEPPGPDGGNNGFGSLVAEAGPRNVSIQDEKGSARAASVIELLGMAIHPCILPGDAP